MRAKGLLSIIMTGAMMASVLSGCGFKPDITWTDTANGSASAYKVTVVVAHDGKLSIDSEQTVKDGDTLNFIATPSKDGDHRITGLMIDGVKRTDYTGELPLEGKVKISLENINQDMTVVVLCDNETGGLGGVDGAVTGLDGSGSGSNGDTDGGDSGNTPVATTHTVTFASDNDSHKDKASAKYDEGGTGSIRLVEGENSGTATVIDGADMTATITPESGWRITDITISGESEEDSWTENQDTGAITFDLNNVDENITIHYTYVQVVGVKFDDNPIVEYDFDTGEYKVTGGKVEISYSDDRGTQTDHLNDPQHGQVSVFGSPEGLEYGKPATVTVTYTPNPVEGVVFTENQLTYDCEVTVKFEKNELEQYFNNQKNKNVLIKDFGDDMSVRVDEWADKHSFETTTGTVTCRVPDQSGKSWTYQLQRVTVPIHGPEGAKEAIDAFYETKVAEASGKSTYHGWVYVRVDITDDNMTMWVVWYQSN